MSLLPFDKKSKGSPNAIKIPSIDRNSRGQSGRNETTRLFELRYVYVYLSFEHEVLGHFPKYVFFYTYAAVFKD